jgi:hypothetical protein
MPTPGTITRGTGTTWHCACGAEAEIVLITTLGDTEPRYIPAGLRESCTCPRCITCGHVLDKHQRCGNLDCPLLGTLIVLPD